MKNKKEKKSHLSSKVSVDNCTGETHYLVIKNKTLIITLRNIRKSSKKKVMSM